MLLSFPVLRLRHLLLYNLDHWKRKNHSDRWLMTPLGSSNTHRTSSAARHVQYNHTLEPNGWFRYTGRVCVDAPQLKQQSRPATTAVSFARWRFFFFSVFLALGADGPPYSPLHYILTLYASFGRLLLLLLLRAVHQRRARYSHSCCGGKSGKLQSGFCTQSSEVGVPSRLC